MPAQTIGEEPLRIEAAELFSEECLSPLERDPGYGRRGLGV